MSDATRAALRGGTKTTADWEMFIIRAALDLDADCLHEAFVYYVTIGCHPAIAARRSLVQHFNTEIARLSPARR